MQKPEFPKLSRKVRNRLAKLADFLSTFKAPKKATFDLQFWGKHAGDHAPVERNYCGTVACAIGWAALSGKFRRSGLSFEWEDDGSSERCLVTNGDDWLDTWEYVPNGGMSRDGFFWLFMPEGYQGGPKATPKLVAKRIRTVLKEQEQRS